VVLLLQGFLTLLLTSLDAFGTKAPATYILDLGLLLAFLLSGILAIILTTRQFPSEVRSGTIFTILTKPISRAEFLLGKWLGCWLGILLTNLLSYSIVVLVVLSRGHMIHFPALFQLFLLHNAMLAVIVSMSLFFTQFVSQGAGSSMAFIAVFLSYYFVPQIPHLLVKEETWRKPVMLAIYYIAPHFDLFDMRRRFVHGWGTLDTKILLGTLLYGFLLSLLFLLMAWLRLRKKQFKRGAWA
jgi:ABC-type transport system involved in multi-copper enzyme maturation permease subunit